MACARMILLLAGCFAVANGRLGYNVFATKKPGTCPSNLSVETCWNRCVGDGQCWGVEKCCPTNCGGALCSKPIKEKPGVCPEAATTDWVCSSTCSTDDHCEGKKKCCKNRCDAFACLIPKAGERPEETPEVVDYDLYNDV